MLRHGPDAFWWLLFRLEPLNSKIAAQPGTHFFLTNEQIIIAAGLDVLLVFQLSDHLEKFVFFETLVLTFSRVMLGIMASSGPTSCLQITQFRVFRVCRSMHASQYEWPQVTMTGWKIFENSIIPYHLPYQTSDRISGRAGRSWDRGALAHRPAKIWKICFFWRVSCVFCVSFSKFHPISVQISII